MSSQLFGMKAYLVGVGTEMHKVMREGDEGIIPACYESQRQMTGFLVVCFLEVEQAWIIRKRKLV